MNTDPAQRPPSDSTSVSSSPSPSSPSSGTDLQQHVERLAHTVEFLQQENRALQNKLNTLEGAVMPLYEDKIADYASGQTLFEHYRAMLVENFEGSVIERIFSSDHFIKRLFASIRQYLFNVRGIVTVLGIGTLGAFGLNTLIENTAKTVFQDRIESEYPQLIDRLERDRNTLMLLILDLNSQDRPNMQIVRSHDLEIDRVREAYLETNPNYQDVLVEFLEGSSDGDTIFADLMTSNDRYKSIQRFYALNYVLQVDPIPEFRDALYEILKDEDIEKVEETMDGIPTAQVPPLDVYNQILAVQALRRYPNQFDNLLNDVLLHESYKNQFSIRFWHGFLNDLIMTQVNETDIEALSELLKNSVFHEQYNQRQFASVMLVLYSLYPQLCDDDTCVPTWLTAAQTKTPQQASTESSKEGSAESSNESDLHSRCINEVTEDNYRELLHHRNPQDVTKPLPDFSQSAELAKTLNCVLQTYVKDRQNFFFYQGHSLFSEEDMSNPQSLSALHQDLHDLQWKSLMGIDGASAFSTFYYDEWEDYFYQAALNDITETETATSGYADTENNDFYRHLLSRSNTDYLSWTLPKFYEQVATEQTTQDAFRKWLDDQYPDINGVSELDQTDSWTLNSFFESAYWDESQNRYAYISFEEYEALSLEHIHRGEGFRYYLNIMSTGYYPTEVWMTEVYSYFEHIWPHVALYDEQQGNDYLYEADPQADLTGTNSEQDALWRWIENYEDQLVFAGDRWDLDTSSESTAHIRN